MSINEFVVTDRQSFVKFLESLQYDLSQNRQAWENKTLEDFIEAMARYAEELQGYYNNQKVAADADVASWKTFSDIIKGARVYE
jgi:hypothetical protein